MSPVIDSRRTLSIGELVVCPGCGLYHRIRPDDNANHSLSFLKCDRLDKIYIVGLDGHPFLSKESEAVLDRMEERWWYRFSRGDTTIW